MSYTKYQRDWYLFVLRFIDKSKRGQRFDSRSLDGRNEIGEQILRLPKVLEIFSIESWLTNSSNQLRPTVGTDSYLILVSVATVNELKCRQLDLSQCTDQLTI